MENCKVNKENMTDRKEGMPQDNLQVEGKGPPHATIEALKHWAQNKAKDADEDGALRLGIR
jgi:hypothetical protein